MASQGSPEPLRTTGSLKLGATTTLVFEKSPTFLLSPHSVLSQPKPQPPPKKKLNILPLKKTTGLGNGQPHKPDDLGSILRTHVFKKLDVGQAQWHRPQIPSPAVLEDQGSIPRTHTKTHNCLPVLGNQMPSFGLQAHLHTPCRHTQEQKHTHKVNTSLKTSNQKGRTE